jgi:hypothetical protein
MKKPEWPGIATAVGIVLILAIIIACARQWDTEAVRQWQTLIAAGIALIAAIIAWAAAMAKLNFDKRQAAIDRRRRMLAVLHRADLALKEIYDRCEEVFDIANERGNAIFSRALERDRVEINEPPEFEIIWDNLDVFPRTLIEKLARIRMSIRAANRMMDEDPLMERLVIDARHGPFVQRLMSVCTAAIADVKPLIKDLIGQA